MTLTTYSMRSARSAGFVAVIAFALLVETSALHLLLVRSHPAIAWALTSSSVGALCWLVIDYRSLGHAVVSIGPGLVAGEIGRRLSFSADASLVRSVGRPQLMPAAGPPKGYINATKPSAPNVLIVFRRPVPVTLLGMSRSASQIALRLDHADVFIRDWVTQSQLSASTTVSA